MRSPFAPYNPFLRPSGSIRAGNIGLGSTAGYISIASFSSTTVGSFQTIASGTIETVADRALLLVPTLVHVSHTDGTATFAIEWFIYQDEAGTVGGVIFTLTPNLKVPAANSPQPIQLTAICELAGANIRPGKHAFGIAIKNNTTGTISTGDPTTSSNAYAYYLVGRA